MELCKMTNIGITLAKRMMQANIGSSEELMEIGSKTAFLKVKTIYPDACINHLYALEGAIQGIRWHYLTATTKEDLKDFYNNL